MVRQVPPGLENFDMDTLENEDVEDRLIPESKLKLEDRMHVTFLVIQVGTGGLPWVIHPPSLPPAGANVHLTECAR